MAEFPADVRILSFLVVRSDFFMPYGFVRPSTRTILRVKEKPDWTVRLSTCWNVSTPRRH